MNTKKRVQHEQLKALGTIRSLVERYFPNQDFYEIERALKYKVRVEDDSCIEFDEETRSYQIIRPARCRVCGMDMPQMIEVKTLGGEVFFLCVMCQHDIASAPTLALTT